MRHSTSRKSKDRDWVFQIFVALFWVGIWQVASMGVGQAIVLPSPWQAVHRLCELLGEPAFYGAVFGSLGRILFGFMLALSVGVLLAAASGIWRHVRLTLQLPMAAISATPIASFAILALVLIGKRNLSVVIAFLMALPVIYLNVLKGIDAADGKLLEMADVFKVGFARRVRAIYVPAARPYLLSASQIALGMCWKSGLAAEVIGQPDGSIGDALYRAKIFMETDAVFAWTIAIVILSIALERIVTRVIRRIGHD